MAMWTWGTLLSFSRICRTSIASVLNLEFRVRVVALVGRIPNPTSWVCLIPTRIRSKPAAHLPGEALRAAATIARRFSSETASGS